MPAVAPPSPPANHRRGDLEPASAAAAAAAGARPPPRPDEEEADDDHDEEILLLRPHQRLPPPLQQQRPWQPRTPRAHSHPNANPYHRRCPRPLLLLLAGVGAGLCLAVRGMVWSSSSSSLGPTVDASTWMHGSVLDPSIHCRRVCLFVLEACLRIHFSPTTKQTNKQGRTRRCSGPWHGMGMTRREHSSRLLDRDWGNGRRRTGAVSPQRTRSHCGRKGRCRSPCESMDGAVRFWV